MHVHKKIARARAAAGATVAEVVVALGVVLVGLVALFGALAARLVGGATAAHLTQAQLEAAGVLERVRAAPAEALDCLAAAPSSWSPCEDVCRRARAAQTNDATAQKNDATAEKPHPENAHSGIAHPGIAHPENARAGAGRAEACAFSAGVPYSVVLDPAAQLAPDGVTRTSRVERRGQVYDVQVTVGWGEGERARPRHFVTLRSAVFR